MPDRKVSAVWLVVATWLGGLVGLFYGARGVAEAQV
jgi:hypothetical protein